MKFNKQQFKYFTLCFLCLPLSNLVYGIESWNKDSVAAQVLLKAEELPGFILRNQYHYTQNWILKDEGKELSVILTIFSTPAEAVIGTGGLARGGAEIPSYGSFSGSIIGDHSWVYTSFNPDIYFVKDNVCVLLIFLKGSKSDRPKVESIARLMANKISHVSSVEVKSKIEQARKTQIPDQDFHRIIDNIQLSGYLKIMQSDSIWALDTNTLVLGRREEFRDTTANTIIIDIAKFSSNELAKQAGKDRSRFAISATWIEDISKPLPAIFPLRLRYSNNSDGNVFAKGNYAIHINFHSETGSIDPTLISQLIPAISNRIP